MPEQTLFSIDGLKKSNAVKRQNSQQLDPEASKKKQLNEAPKTLNPKCFRNLNAPLHPKLQRWSCPSVASAMARLWKAQNWRLRLSSRQMQRMRDLGLFWFRLEGFRVWGFPVSAWTLQKLPF